MPTESDTSNWYCTRVVVLSPVQRTFSFATATPRENHIRVVPSIRLALTLHCYEVELGQRTIPGVFVGRFFK